MLNTGRNNPTFYHKNPIPPHDKVIITTENLTKQNAKSEKETIALASPVYDNVSELIVDDNFKVDHDSYNFIFNKQDLKCTLVWD